MKLFNVSLEIYGSDLSDARFTVLATDPHTAVAEALKNPELEKLLRENHACRLHCNAEQGAVLTSELPKRANVCAMASEPTKPDFAALGKALVDACVGAFETLRQPLDASRKR